MDARPARVVRQSRQLRRASKRTRVSNVAIAGRLRRMAAPSLRWRQPLDCGRRPIDSVRQAFAMAIVRVVIMLLPLLTCGCAVLPQICLPPAQSMVSAELLFGRDIGDRVGVS